VRRRSPFWQFERDKDETAIACAAVDHRLIEASPVFVAFVRDADLAVLEVDLKLLAFLDLDAGFPVIGEFA
jgi:hypothetical protein